MRARIVREERHDRVRPVDGPRGDAHHVRGVHLEKVLEPTLPIDVASIAVVCLVPGVWVRV